MAALERGISAADLSQKRPCSPPSLGTLKRVKCEPSQRPSQRIADGVQDPKMVSQRSPYKPDDEERDRYYYGFAGNPRLVARTSSHRWLKPMHHEGLGDRLVQTPKKYAAIVDHELASKWSKDLSLTIIAILDKCAWSFFFPIRIDLERISGECLPKDGEPRPEVSTVLLVAVKKNSLQWEDGVTIALRCREVLHSFRIFDVEVEIREGQYQRHAASVPLEAEVDPTAWNKTTNQAILPMLSSLGYPIAYLEDQPGAGTVGLYLELENKESVVYALTCRHVVANNREPSKSYKLSEAEEHLQYHVQANNTGFDECLQSLMSIQKNLENSIQPLANKKMEWDEWYSQEEDTRHKPPTEEEIHRLQVWQSLADYNAKIMKQLRAINDKTKRKIGHLAFLPPYTVSSQQPGYFKDWALVLLDLAKFIKNPENKVFIGVVPKDQLPEELLDNGFLTLHLQDKDNMNDGAFPIGKRGMKTGLTFGTKSNIEAVVRNLGPGMKVNTWEMLIVPERKRFSDNGDSGASVFDLEGNVVGMVVGSSDEAPDGKWRGFSERPSENASENPSEPDSKILKRHPGGTVGPEEADVTPIQDLDSWSNATDITFATPIQWVLDDIQAFTGLQPRLA